MIENAGCFSHFHHEGGLAGVQFIAGTDAGKDAIGDANDGAFRWHEAPHMCKEDNQRGLTNVGALAGHVWSGDECQCCRLERGAKFSVIGNESVAQQFIKNGVAATGDFKDRFFHNFWANPAVARGNFGKACNSVEACNGVSKADEFREAFGCFGAECIKERAFAGNGARLGGENLVLKRLQLRRDVALGVAQRLAARELSGRL